MKKHILTLAALLGITGTMMAQTDGPNRLLVVDQNQQYKAFNLGNVNKVEFATVEGEVAANLEIMSSSRTELSVKVTRTPDCSSFMINIMPGVTARQIEKNPSNAGEYMESIESPKYAEDFTSGSLTGFELPYNTEYAVATVGFDSYGVACDFRAEYFTTEKAPIEGSPKVDLKVVNTGLTTIDLHFTPNDDTSTYSFCIFTEGNAQQQFETFGPAFGFSNIGQMITSFGGSNSGVVDYQYKDLDPNTKYELYVQPLDKNGNMADLQIFDLETLSQGGSGDAHVDIALSEYKLADWNGEMKPSQFITFTPNDQSWCYRFGVYLAPIYDANPDAIKEEIASEPPMPDMAHWFFFSPVTTDFQINPNTEFVVIATAKNADGVWGEANVSRYTTPASTNGAPAMQKASSLNGPAKIAARFAPKSKSMFPALLSNKIVLTK